MSGKKHSGNRGKRRTNRQQGGSSEKKRSNLFKDLEKLAIHQIEEMLREVKSDIRSTEAQSESLRNERRQLIEIVTSLRESLKKGSGILKRNVHSGNNSLLFKISVMRHRIFVMMQIGECRLFSTRLWIH